MIIMITVMNGPYNPITLKNVGKVRGGENQSK